MIKTTFLHSDPDKTRLRLDCTSPQPPSCKYFWARHATLPPEYNQTSRYLGLGPTQDWCSDSEEQTGSEDIFITLFIVSFFLLSALFIASRVPYFNQCRKVVVIVIYYYWKKNLKRKYFSESQTGRAREFPTLSRSGGSRWRPAGSIATPV